MEDWKIPWETDLIPLETFTGDRRWFSQDGVTSRALPMPLCLQVKTDQGHRGSVTVGVTEWIKAGETMIRAGGSWLNPTGVPEVLRALELCRNGVAKVSADLEPDMEITVEEPESPGERPFIYCHRAKICGVTIVPIGAFDLPGIQMSFGIPEYASLAITGTTSWRSMPAQPREIEYNADEAFKRILAWADGNDARARSMFLWFDPQAAEGARDRFRLPIGDIVEGRPALNFHAIYAAAALISGAHGGLPTVSNEERGRLRRTISEIYKRLASLYGDPELAAPWDKRAKMPDVSATGLEAVAASAAPVAPPDDWFTDPKLPGPTPSPIVTPDGRVMVHLATHGSCHRGIQQMSGQCFTPPPSPSKYLRFMDGSVVTASGRTVPVGRITADTSHAPIPLAAKTAKDHYDNTGSCVAIVAAGEDEYGIWLSGALVSEATPQRVAMLRRSPISGDWRRHGAEGLDLVAALCVNVAGYPAPYLGAVRTLSVDQGECQTLVASGPPVGDDVSMSDAPDIQPKEPVQRDEPSPVTATPGVDAATSGPDVAAIVEAAVARAVADVRQRENLGERLATMLAMRDFENSQVLAGFEKLAVSDSISSRRIAQREGEALPPLSRGGTPRYPIRNVGELRDAIRAVGRGKGSHDGIRRWIIKRARAIGSPELIPENWNPDGSLKE